MQQDALLEMLEMIPAGIIVADKAGYIAYANAQAQGYVGKQGLSLDEVNIARLLKSVTSGKETLMRMRDGRRIPVRILINDLADGRRMVILDDISEIHQLQQEILKMDRLASVGELTSGIAHEIRNPLAGIKTTAQALEEELPEGDHRRDYVGRIIKEINRLNKLLLDFFDFAKPRSMHTRRCNMQKVIEEAIYLVREQARQQGVQIIEMYPTAEVDAVVDPDMIKQVLMNVMLNGVQAMSSGGRLEVSLDNIDEEYIGIIIKDGGPGIPENLKSRIFDPFFTTKAKGVGLGLSISYRIIRMHTGSITVTSTSSGTTFRIALLKEHIAGG